MTYIFHRQILIFRLYKTTLHIPTMANQRIVANEAQVVFGAEVVKWDRETIRQNILVMDRQKGSRLFEAVVMHRKGMTLWENLPPQTLVRKRALRYRKCFPDFGVWWSSRWHLWNSSGKIVRPKTHCVFRWRVYVSLHIFWGNGC